VLLFFLLVAGGLVFVGLLTKDSEPPAVSPSIAKTTLNHNRDDQSVTVPATPPEKQDDHPVNWLDSYRAKAKEGNVEAMFRLGVIYNNGEGVIKDDKEAFKWYRKAAELGHARAMTNLGYMYANGKGVIKDDQEAVKWYRKAAELGHAGAMFNLGLMYSKGKVVNQDAVEAYAWINVAAAKGQKKAAEYRNTIKKTMTPEQIAEGQKRSREIMKSISKN